jgi:hypothetical protein
MLNHTHQIVPKRVLPFLAGTAGAAAAISVALASDLSDVDSGLLYASEKALEQKDRCAHQTWPYIDANCVDGSQAQLRRIRVIPIGASTPSHVLAAMPMSVPAIERGAHSKPPESRHESAALLHTGAPNSQVGSEGFDPADDAAVVRVVRDGKVTTYRVPKSRPLGPRPTPHTGIRSWRVADPATSRISK